jgi:hypothetical protein
VVGRLVVVALTDRGYHWTYRLPKELVPLAMKLSVFRHASSNVSIVYEKRKPSLSTLHNPRVGRQRGDAAPDGIGWSQLVGVVECAVAIAFRFPMMP